MPASRAVKRSWCAKYARGLAQKVEGPDLVLRGFESVVATHFIALIRWLMPLAAAISLLSACNASQERRRARAVESSVSSASSQGQPSSASAPSRQGIKGQMVVAWGNAPAELPDVKCVKVYDAAERSLVAEGVCRGASRSFSVPLEPGEYVVELGGHWEPDPTGRPRYVPERRRVSVTSGNWVDLSPPGPPGPVN